MGTSADVTNRIKEARDYLSPPRGTPVQTVGHTLGWFNQDTCQTLKTRLELQRIGSTSALGFSIICWGWWQNHTSVFPCFGQDSPLFGAAVCQIHLSQAWFQNQVSNWLHILYYTSVKQDKGRGESSLEHALGEWFSWNAAFPVAQKLPFHLKAIKDYSRMPAITKPKRLFVYYLCSTGFYFSSDCLQAG